MARSVVPRKAVVRRTNPPANPPQQPTKAPVNHRLARLLAKVIARAHAGKTLTATMLRELESAHAQLQ